MIRIIDFRLIIEKHDTHEKYYPKVVSFNTVDAIPLTNAPSSTIRIVSSSNLNGVSTVSQVEFDDIIRLQSSTKFNILDQDVWVDLFEGRVQNQSKELGENNDIEFECAGHIKAAFNKVIPVSATFSNKDASEILQSVTTTNLVRISYDAKYITNGPTVAEYNVEGKQNFVIDAYKEMETVSGNRRMIDVVPVYLSNGNLQTCYLRWRPLSSVVTKQYAVIEGTPRLISAKFDLVGDDIANYRYVQGGTDESGNQYSGSAYDAESVTKYGTIDAIDSCSWVKSNSLCHDIAQGLVDASGKSYVAGQVVLEGTPDAHIGDLVLVKIPSLDIKGVSINGYYTVYRVVHNFSGSEFKTTLDLGRIKKNEYDYISKNITQVLKIAYKNQIKR